MTRRVWDIASGRTLFVLSPPPGTILGSTAVSFSADGRLLGFAQPNDANLPDPSEVWDVNSGQKLFNLGPLVRYSSIVFGIAFSPDGRRAATANASGTAVIWDAATGQPLLMLPGHTSYMQDVAFSPDGRNLASVSQDGSAQIWDVATGQEQLTLTSSPAQLTRVAYSPDGRRLLTAGSDAIRVHVLPIEVLPFGWRSQARFLESLGAKYRIRQMPDGGEYRTDQGNLILDCDFGPIADPANLARQLEARAGIVEHGLFLGLTSSVIVSSANGVREIKPK